MKTITCYSLIVTFLASLTVFGQNGIKLDPITQQKHNPGKEIPMSNQKIECKTNNNPTSIISFSNPWNNTVYPEISGIGDTFLLINPGSWIESHADPPKVSIKYLSVKNTSTSLVFFNMIVNACDIFDFQKNEHLTESLSQNDELSNFEISIAINPFYTVSPKPGNTFIRYDDGVNYGSYGRLHGGTFEVAAYFPGDSLTQYLGMILSQIEIFVWDVPMITNLRIYGEGTPSEPGILMYEEMVFPSGSSWNLFTLSEEIEITGEDLWLGYQVTHTAGDKPVGFDDGPVVAGYGDLYHSFGSWINFSGFGYDCNWNIAGYLNEGSNGATKDVGVQAILSPETGFNLGMESVTIRIKNYGTETQNQIPVLLFIDSIQVCSGIIPVTLPGGTTIDYTFPEVMNLNFNNVGQTYVLTVCTALPGDEFAENDCKTASITNAVPVYCYAYSSWEGEYISGVFFGAIENLSGWQIPVADYTNIFNPLTAGDSEAIMVTNGNPWAKDRVCAWVDWNSDVVFDPFTEDYSLDDTTGTGQFYTGEISIPQDVEPGEYRMRIGMVYDYNPLPCNVSGWGETEDYTITVIEKPVNDVGLQIVLSPVSGENLGEEIVKVRIKNYGISQQSNVPVSYSVNGGNSVNEIIPGPIASGETMDYCFLQAVNLSNPGETYTITACTALSNDEIDANNCKTTYVTHKEPSYCMPYNKLASRYIYRVRCGEIDNISEWQDSVADYTSLSTTIENGASEDIFVSVNTSLSGAKINAWVDWNGDFTFDSNYEMFEIRSSFGGEIIVPADVLPGEYRMRVRLDWDLDPVPCANSYWGETEDYTITVVAQPTNDVGVHYILSPGSFFYLGDEVVKIRVKNFGSATQTDIPVYYTLDGGPPVPGVVEGPIYSRETFDYIFPGTINLGTLNQTYAFNICTNLPGDEVLINDCKAINVTNLYPGYCDASTSTEDEFIANVLFGEIDNSSGWQGYVADYTDLSTMINVGESDTIIITNGNPWANDIVYAWVDWNKDFEFEWGTCPEMYILTNIGGTGEIFSGAISVPEGTANGDYRMRIRMTYSSPPGPCCNATYGEIEDYTITVTGGQPPCWLTATPTSGTLYPDESMNVMLFFNSFGHSTGLYSGSIDFITSEPFITLINVPITLFIGICPLPPPINLTVYEVFPGVAHVAWDEPVPPDDLLGYNVYRDGEMINPDTISNLFYEDTLVGFDQYFYYVTAVYPECEAASDTVTLLITQILEMDKTGILIFPNPATHFIHIQSHMNISQIVIVDNMGSVVHNSFVDSKSIEVNTSNYQKGIYCIRVITSGELITQKLIIR
nr:T9SS type A sorting domain-containing protein [Bacteroidota bacterium]